MNREQRLRAYEAALLDRAAAAYPGDGKRRPCVSCGLWTFLLDAEGLPRHLQCVEAPQ